MKKDTHFHLLHYLVLVILLLLSVVLFFTSSGNNQLQLKIAIATSVGYFLWGTAHHYLEGDLHPKIMVEYLLIAVLALLLLKGAIFR